MKSIHIEKGNQEVRKLSMKDNTVGEKIRDTFLNFDTLRVNKASSLNFFIMFTVLYTFKLISYSDLIYGIFLVLEVIKGRQKTR